MKLCWPLISFQCLAHFKDMDIHVCSLPSFFKWQIGERCALKFFSTFYTYIVLSFVMTKHWLLSFWLESFYQKFLQAPRALLCNFLLRIFLFLLNAFFVVVVFFCNFYLTFYGIFYLILLLFRGLNNLIFSLFLDKA